MIDIAHNDETFKRSVRGVERYFLRRPNANVIMVAKIRGAVSANRLKIALSKVRKRHTLLGARIILDDQDIAWFITKGVPEIVVQTQPLISNDGWIQTAIEETNNYFPLDKGPLIRFILLSSSEISELVIVSHHTICDGLSLAYLLRDILLHLGDPDREVEPLPNPPQVGAGNLPPSASLSALPRMGINFFNKLWERKNIHFSEEDYKTLHQAFWKENDQAFILAWGLSKSETASLISRCRDEKVSVHSALSTAFLLAQSDVQVDAPSYLHDLSMTVNIRGRLSPPVGEALGAYFSSFRIEHRFRQDHPFWSNARIFHKRIKQQLTDKKIFEVQQQLDALHPTLLDSLYFSKYGVLEDKFAAIFLRIEGDDRINTSLDIANLGRLDFPRNFGPLQLEALYGPSQYVDFQEKYLGVLTLGGRMFFTLTFDESVISKATVEAIKDAAMAYLREANEDDVERKVFV